MKTLCLIFALTRVHLLCLLLLLMLLLMLLLQVKQFISDTVKAKKPRSPVSSR
jgi:hypothetical protein